MEHVEALQHVGLSRGRFPTLKQVLERGGSGSSRRSCSRANNFDKSRAVFFCLGYFKFWKTPIHVVLRCLCNTHNLRWL
jgi:hypothetical protein